MFKKLAALAFALVLIAPAMLFAATPVNINKADAATLAKSLDRVGQSKAQAIVDYRQAHGPFKKVDDLGHVKGIGKATIERNRAVILLADKASGVADGAAAPVEDATKSAETATPPTKASKK